MLKDMDDLTQPIIDIYNQIELQLLIDIAKRFDTYDTIGGSLEWHLKKLDEMGALNKDAVDTIAYYSKQSRPVIESMLKGAGFANIDIPSMTKAFGMGLLSVNPQKMLDSPVMRATLDKSYKELDKAYKLINTQALESVKQSYMNVINQSYIEVSSGVYDYNTAIRRALQGMAAQGITGATYKRGDTLVKYSIEGTVRRDTLTAVHQLANKVSFDACDELGAEYVEISSHIGARVSLVSQIANHAGWQGKVFKVHGFDEKYGNLKNNTGYPDDIQGLGGVNCRHRMFPFIPGVSVPNPIQYSEEENAKRYKLSQEQRAKERKIRQTQKQIAVAEASNDVAYTAILKKKLLSQRKDIIKWCNDNGMKRDFTREEII